MTWDSIINVDEWNKDAIKAFEENKKKVDAGELEITMLIETEGVKQVLAAKYTTIIEVGFYNRIPHDKNVVLDVYPNNFDYVEKYEAPSKFIPGGWDYLFRPRKDGEQSLAFQL
jgi:hypothetical protein